MHSVHLKKGREESLLRRHPWIFSGAVERVKGKPDTGDTVTVFDAKGQAVAVGAWSPASQIRVRVWDFKPDTEIDREFFRSRLMRALDARKELSSNAMRMVYSEADELPGLIVDRYGDVLVCQFLSAGIEKHKPLLVDLLVELMQCRSVYERSDSTVRGKEGLTSQAGLLAGEEPPQLIEIGENAVRFLVDIRNGHKTGFYLDQRENRAWLQNTCRDAEILNCFAYTGGFGLAALSGGAAQVTNVDSSGPALSLARQNAELNGFSERQFITVEDNVFEYLRRLQNDSRSFDMIVVDPPKFIENNKQLKRGARAYKDVNLQAFKLLRPGGLLLTFSCSGLLAPGLFQKIVADAALDAACHGHIIHRLQQAGDHPVSLNFPEADYLKGLCIRKSI